jgi:hypothetical protein
LPTLWRVNDTTRASINESGLVQTRQAGSVVVTACPQDHPPYCGNATLHIIQPLTEP